MGLLNLLFGGGIKGKAASLWSIFKRDRKEWYPRFVEELQVGVDLADSLGWDSAITSLKNTSLGGRGEIAMKACQIYWVAKYISQKGYVQKDDVEEFRTLLWSYLFEDDPEHYRQSAKNECGEIIQTYSDSGMAF